jgi:hypothetical protein
MLRFLREELQKVAMGNDSHASKFLWFALKAPHRFFFPA